VVHRQRADGQVERVVGECQGGRVADQERRSALVAVPRAVGVGSGALDMAGSRSRPVTSRPFRRASRFDRWPGPHPTSSTRAPGEAAAATSAAMPP
jgi:hypothetical protein